MLSTVKTHQASEWLPRRVNSELPRAQQTAGCDTEGVRGVTLLDLALGPAVAFGAIGVLILVSRWMNAPPKLRRFRPRKPRFLSGPPDYGLLVPVASLPSYAVASRVRDRLRSHGIRSTLGPAADGAVQVLVFPTDRSRAEAFVRPESSPDRNL